MLVENITKIKGERKMAEPKSKTTVLLVSLFLGVLGADRFMLGYTGLGILKLCTFGGCSIWAIIDFIRIANGSLKMKDGTALTET